jgi:lipoprotein NlpD
MKPTPRLALLTFSIVLSACSTAPRQAPVSSSARYRRQQDRPPHPEPRRRRRPRTERARGSYTVRKGDTLLRIALDYGQNYRDLVAWNNLADPDDIKVGQVLRVTLPPTAAPATAWPAPTHRHAGRREAPPPAEEDRAARRQETVHRGNLATARGRQARASPTRKPPSDPVRRPSCACRSRQHRHRQRRRKAELDVAVERRIIATFDEGKNKGIDIAGKLGQQVMAAGAGKVMYAGSGIRGYGNLVIVKHSNSLLSAYAHNRAIVVKEGESVAKGQAIAEMGDSDADTVKLHFEIRQQGKPVDPSKFLPSR